MHINEAFKIYQAVHVATEAHTPAPAVNQIFSDTARNIGDYICGWYLHKVMS